MNRNPSAALRHLLDIVVGALWWLVPATLAVLTVVVLVAVIVGSGRYRHGSGLASSTQVNSVASRGALTSAAKYTRPGWERRPPKVERTVRGAARFGDVGTRIGKAGWGRLWWFGASHEDAIGVLAPQRQGKTRRLLARFAADAPGTVVVASTKLDALGLTRPLVGDRAVTVFDPDQILTDDLRFDTQLVRWSPVIGCERSAVAIRRAQAFVGDGGESDATNSRFFAGSAAQVLQCLLHAAALSGASMTDVVRWAADPRDRQPVKILTDHPTAAPGWSAILAGHTAGARSEADVFKQLNLALNLFADPAVLAQASPGPGGQFDVDTFLHSGDALYVLSSSQAVNSSAYTTMFITELLTRAQDVALSFEHHRWEPPVTFVLDELTNTARVPTFPQVLADSGGRGIAIRWAAQSRSQLVEVWGQHGAASMLANSTWKVILQGLDDAAFLGDLERLAGQVDQRVPGAGGVWTGDRAPSPRTRQVPALPAAEIRTQRKMTATVWATSLPPFRARLVDIAEEARHMGRKADERGGGLGHSQGPPAGVPVAERSTRASAPGR